MKEAWLTEVHNWSSKDAYNWWLFTDIDKPLEIVMQEINGSLEFDILGE